MLHVKLYDDRWWISMTTARIAIRKKMHHVHIPMNSSTVLYWNNNEWLGKSYPSASKTRDLWIFSSICVQR